MSIYFKRFRRLFKYEGKIMPLTFKTRCVLTYRSFKTWIWSRPTSCTNFIKGIWSIWKPIKCETWENTRRESVDVNLEILIPTIATTDHEHMNIKWFPTEPAKVLKEWEEGKSKAEIKKEVLDTSKCYHIDSLSVNKQMVARKVK